MPNGAMNKDKNEKQFRLLLISIIIFLTIMMFFIEGSLKWLLGLSIILFIGGIVVFEIYEGTRDITFWDRNNELDRIVNMNLERLSEIAGRAYRDRTVSKALFEERIKEEFIKKLKNHKNLSDAEMKRLLKDTNRLRKIIGDDLITEFIVGDKSYTQAVQDQSKPKKSFLNKLGFRNISINKDYKERIDEVLKRMEEWN